MCRNIRKKDYKSFKISFKSFGCKFDGPQPRYIYMCAQYITFHSSVDSSTSDMDLESTKNHSNLYVKATDITNC